MKTYNDLVKGVENGTVKVPVVSYENNDIPYTKYILAIHKFNLGLMSKGMLVRGVKLKHLKDYYGLKGRSAKDCYKEFCAMYF